MTMHIPVGLNLTAIGVSTAWWLDAARRTEAAGFDSLWIWDHFVSRGRLTDPLLECWSMLAAAATVTSRIRLGPFVSNVMNRHPAVLANIAATVAELSGGRLELGIGAGGHPAEHAAYGIPFPERPERAEHLVEAIEVLRLLLAGGPADYAGRHYRLAAAHAFPAPTPPPRITVAGVTPKGARLAARHGDAWTCFGDSYDALRPVFLAELAAAGRSAADVPILVAVEVEELAGGLDELTARWRERGAAELIIHDVFARELDDVLALALDDRGGPDHSAARAGRPR
jgi:alkanesulfonate monooxygenase SsuD/methylene tetrahydromethanopterin reductase-like flavin-dependent oxidoreductase (luciferase family)